MAVGEGQPADIKANSLYPSQRSDEVILRQTHTLQREKMTPLKFHQLQKVDDSSVSPCRRGLLGVVLVTVVL